MNKALKCFLLVLSLLAIVSCDSHKSIKDDQADMSMSTTNNIENSGSQFSSERLSRLQIQTLKKENIIYFELDKYNISADFVHILDAHVNFLRNNHFYKVTIEGHADERGTPEYNIALGELRANAVKMYLQSQGILADQISIVSYGKEKPAILGHNEVAYAKNRRAVLVY
ncbi:peptidoglycan-associated outer membrane lipoprotein member of Tol-Pal system [Serratia symbiotica str. 'Cinara cedri']|nr:peptidoglycan-associated outer membrane lipoprotein member of Tol-Pal system [Serratia symbiotica str. 'Cinara cedri']